MWAGRAWAGYTSCVSCPWLQVLPACWGGGAEVGHPSVALPPLQVGVLQHCCSAVTLLLSLEAYAVCRLPPSVRLCQISKLPCTRVMSPLPKTTYPHPEPVQTLALRPFGKLCTICTICMCCCAGSATPVFVLPYLARTLLPVLTYANPCIALLCAVPCRTGCLSQQQKQLCGCRSCCKPGAGCRL